MLMRWVAAGWLAAEKSFRKIMRHEHLWALEAILKGKSAERQGVA